MRELQQRHSRMPIGPASGTPEHPRAAHRLAKGPALMLAHQQAYGNQAMQRLLRSRVIQTKFSVSQPDDEFEREADRVAAEVMRMPMPLVAQESMVSGQVRGAHIQRMCPQCEKEEEQTLQAKEVPGPTPAVPPEAQTQVAAMQGGGQPLPESVRGFFEQRFGSDFSQVRIHADASAGRSGTGAKCAGLHPGA